MTLEELATEYLAGMPPGLVLNEEQIVAVAIAAARFYAGYGDIRSISQSNSLPAAPGVGGLYPVVDPTLDPLQREAFPIRRLDQIDEETEITTGEWAIIRPLFILYAERGSATMIEATRGLGVDVFGRSVSEIAQEIMVMEGETLPSKCFVSMLIEV